MILEDLERRRPPGPRHPRHQQDASTRRAFWPHRKPLDHLRCSSPDYSGQRPGRQRASEEAQLCRRRGLERGQRDQRNGDAQDASRTAVPAGARSHPKGRDRRSAPAAPRRPPRRGRCRRRGPRSGRRSPPARAPGPGPPARRSTVWSSATRLRAAVDQAQRQIRFAGPRTGRAARPPRRRSPPRWRGPAASSLTTAPAGGCKSGRR